MAYTTDFEVGQGETFKLLVHIYTETTASIPLDISTKALSPSSSVTCSFQGQLRENYTTDEIAGTFTIHKLEPYESGSVFVYLYPEDTTQLSQRSYVYDIVMTKEETGTGNVPTVRRLLEGHMRVRPSVTRL